MQPLNEAIVNEKLLNLHDKYLQVQKLLLMQKESPLLNRHALEDLSLHGNVWQYLGDEYKPMQAFSQRLRMPAPPFLFVSRLTGVAFARQPGNMAECYFEYDIPKDTIFQAYGRVHEFVLAECCHAFAYLAYFLFKNEIIAESSGLRGSNGSIEYFENMPKPGATIKGHIQVTDILTTASGKLAKIKYRCYHQHKLLFILENYSAVINPKKTHFIKRPLPDAFLNLTDTKNYDEQQVAEFYQGNFARCFGTNYENFFGWRPCIDEHRLLSCVRIFSQKDDPSKDVVIGDFDLSDKHWAFGSHFIEDSLFPASLMSFALFQLLVFYAIANRFYQPSKNLRPVQCRNIQLKRKLLNPLLPQNNTIYFRLDINDVHGQTAPKIMATATVFTNEWLFAEFDSFGIEFMEITDAK